MKFENIKVGMKLQHKESGIIYVVESVKKFKFELLGELHDRLCIEARLFRKYKGDVK